MSYFHGTPLSSLDQSTTKNDKKKHRRRSSSNDNELEPVHGNTRHRRKHPSRSRFIPKFNKGDDENNDSFSPKHKCKRHKDIGKLINDNEKLMATPESGFIEELSEKDNQLSKSRAKYSKLEKSFKTIEEENSMLRQVLEKKEKNLLEINSAYDQLSQHVQLLDQEKSNLIGGYKKLKSENTQLNEDISLLKVLIYKLNVELERYQDKLRGSQGQDEPRSEDPASESSRVVESWGRVDSHVLAPLLEAYQENLEEKEELIKQYKCEMDDFSGKCKEIVGENEILRREIEQYKSEIEKISTEIKTIEEDATIIKEENEILTKQASLQKQKLQEIHSIYEKKVESMSKDNNQLHATYITCKTELSNIQGKYEILNEAFEKFKKNCENTMPVSVHNQAIDECKRLFEELKCQYEMEKRKLLGQLKRFEECNPENEKIIAVLSAEKDQLKILNRNLEKNLKRTQHKLECLQNTMYSIQISRDSFKRQLSKTTGYCEELVKEQEKLLSEKNELLSLLEEREKENKNIQTLGDNIALRMNTLKSQLKSVQKGAREQLDTVEKQMKSQELGVGRMKSDYNHELYRLKQLLKQKEDVIGKLQREKYATQDNLEFVWKSATSHDKKTKDSNKIIKNNP